MSEPLRFLSCEQVLDRVCVSRSQLYKLIRAGEFPPSIRITPNRTAWPETAVDAWIRSKIEAASARA